jgi:hypothetical protein
MVHGAAGDVAGVVEDHGETLTRQFGKCNAFFRLAHGPLLSRVAMQPLALPTRCPARLHSLDLGG